MDKAEGKLGLVIKALRYARKHKLDINNRDDVKKILEVIDPDHTSEEEINTFMSLLQDQYTFMTKLAREKTKKIDLPN